LVSVRSTKLGRSKSSEVQTCATSSNLRGAPALFLQFPCGAHPPGVAHLVRTITTGDGLVSKLVFCVEVLGR
jgi:hypothetical protein